jgi:hypothetical protein
LPSQVGKRSTAEDQAAATEPMSLQDTLNVFFQDEQLSDFSCPKCSTSERMFIKRKFVRMPRVLILHLKRYQLHETPVNSGSCKNQQQSNAEFDSLWQAAPNLSAADEQQPSSTTTTSRPAITYSLVKNDAVVRISRYLTLKHLVNSSGSDNGSITSDANDSKECVELPKPMRSVVNLATLRKLCREKLLNEVELFGDSESNMMQSSSAAKVPFRLADMNQKSSNTQSNTESEEKRSPLSDYFKPISRTIKIVDNIKSKREQNESSAKSFIDQQKLSAVALKKATANRERSSSPLPDLNAASDARVSFDAQNYILKEMSEEDQIELALKQSLSGIETESQPQQQKRKANNDAANLSKNLSNTINLIDLDVNLPQQHQHQSRSGLRGGSGGTNFSKYNIVCL